jgi:hypothetical protein
VISLVNVNLLKAETIKRGYKDKDIAEKALKISPQAYAKKLRNITKFSTDDADTICGFLGIVDRELKADIFLA